MENTGSLLNKCKIICKAYEKKILNCPEDELFYQFCDDIIHMAFLIAVSDGYVDVKEVDMINFTFGVSFDYNSLARSYGLDYISDESFMKQIPISIKTVAEIEKRENPHPNTFLEDTRVLYSAMKQFGNDMLNCTGATLKFSVMIQSYFINNVLKYVFRMEELDGFNNSQLNEAMTYTKTRLSQNNTADFVNPNIQQNASNEEKEIERGGLKLKTHSVNENPVKTDNSVQEPDNKADAEKNLESYRGDLSLASGKTAKTHTTSITSNAIDMDTIHEILSEVDNLIGLGNVKKEIHDMVNMMLINEMRRRKGLKNPVVSRHLVFTGNPGTGKTTIARAIGKIYKTLGILEKGHMIETDRAGMVAGYMGQTAEKVTEVVQKAMGGILFIDEAYSLVTDSEGDFGQEAINTLLKLMEDNRDSLVVIVAGYTEEMKDFIDSNPGLRSRFNRYIQFNDYSDEELLQIFKSYVDEQDYILEEGTDGEILSAISRIRSEDGDSFGNARSMRNYFEKVISNQANRLIDISSSAVMDADEDELMTIIKEDLQITCN
ncbi:ATPase family associated with various cellular activities (AAA) [Lachnospiraceae bacterium]|nr:ATPase family associated with various cellular activities (AAA) [Lachnospiraceae bacterium]